MHRLKTTCDRRQSVVTVGVLCRREGAQTSGRSLWCGLARRTLLCSFKRYEALVGLHENAMELRDFFTLGCNQINHSFEVIIGRWLVKRRRHFGANFRFFLQVSF